MSSKTCLMWSRSLCRIPKCTKCVIDIKSNKDFYHPVNNLVVAVHIPAVRYFPGSVCPSHKKKGLVTLALKFSVLQVTPIRSHY